jgi:hypothetical protein
MRAQVVSIVERELQYPVMLTPGPSRSEFPVVSNPTFSSGFFSQKKTGAEAPVALLEIAISESVAQA